MATIICIDPGHGANYNRGAYTPYYEGNKMYDLGVMLVEEINKYSGLKAIITRKSITDDPELYDRGVMARNYGAKCFLSLHTNAVYDSSVNTVYIYKSIFGTSQLGYKLLDAIYNTIAPDVPTTKSTTLQTRINSKGNADYYGVLRNSIGGSVTESYIIEHVFHTNYKQAEWMYNNNNLRKLSKAEAKAIAEYYGASGTYNGGSGDSNKDSGSSTTPNTPATGAYTNYTVKYGDSWWSIAADQMGSGMKMTELASYNNKTTSSIIHPGDVLKIPNGSSKATYYNYTVKSGDSWWGIAYKEMKDGSRMGYLANYNGKTTSVVLHPGDVIKIPTA